MSASATTPEWRDQVFETLQRNRIEQVVYVPDAGHSRLIARAHAEPAMRAYPLSTEEEGVAAVCGAWLGGQRSVLLMQSSGVGNCVNMLSLMSNCRFPLVTLVTMRGEWAEFNPWQVPMAQAVPKVLEAMNVRVWSLEQAADAQPMLSAAYGLAFGSEQIVAILVRQRLLGAKTFATAEGAGR